MLKVLYFLALLSFFINLLYSVNISEEHSEVCVVYFYGDGCFHCAKISPFIEEVERKYEGKIKLHKFEIYHNKENYLLFSQYCSIEDIKEDTRGIPFIAVGETYLIGEKEIRDRLEEAIENELRMGRKVCPLKGMMACHAENNSTSPAIPGFDGKITPPIIFISGLFDGINPCAFAVLIFFLSYLLFVSPNRNKLLKAGIAYISAVYVTYFLAGLGLLLIFSSPFISNFIFYASASIAIITGLINIKDFFWYGKGISLKIPESRKKDIERFVLKANVPAAIALGFVVSIYELPCTGGIYLAVLGMLANKFTQASGILYLLLYNLAFVLPLIILLCAIYFGLKIEHIEAWRKAKRNYMKLLIGLLLLILGLGMFFDWF